MKIIKANETHIPEILEIYAKARKFMKENGNPTQWEEGYPSREVVERCCSRSLLCLHGK